MSYCEDSARAFTAKKYCFPGILAAMLVVVATVASAVPTARVVVPEHDNLLNIQPAIMGTQSMQCNSGVASGFACNNVDLLARVPLASMGGGSGSDSWGWKDTESGRYYALVARSNGTSFVDVTDPESPIYLGNLPSTTGNQPWRDVKVYSDHAFIVADGIAGHGMQVFDLTRLRGVDSVQVFSPDALYDDIGAAHNIAINEDSGFAYIVGSTQCAGGLHMVDISNPTSPSFAGCFSADGYTHDVHCLIYSGPDEDHQGSEICFASNEDSLTIVDVSNKAAAVMLGKVAYPNLAFSHQGWLDRDQGLFFMGDEIDELMFGNNTRTLIFDVRDLDNPVYSTAHIHSTSVIDHNMYVNGNHLYQANYQGGLRILRIDRSESIGLTEVAYFDTEPQVDSLGFSGAWNVYPFFDNGIILVSDINNGLFLLRASLDDAAENAPINGRLSGAWVSQGLNDQGFMLFVDETDSGPVIFFAWFVFLNGEPFWLTGATGFAYGVDEVMIPTQRLFGLEFLMPGSETAIRENIGTLSLKVRGCNDIHVAYDFIDLGSDELDFQRLAGVQGRACSE